MRDDVIIYWTADILYHDLPLSDVQTSIAVEGIYIWDGLESYRISSSYTSRWGQLVLDSVFDKFYYPIISTDKDNQVHSITKVNCKL